MTKTTILLAVILSFMFAGSAIASNLDHKIDSCLSYIDKDDDKITDNDIQSFKGCMNSVLNELENELMAAPGQKAVCMRPVFSRAKQGLMGCIKNLSIHTTEAEAEVLGRCLDNESKIFNAGKKQCGVD
ncbi:hypothetical protein [Maridesulfovibrio salexigens]|nr:hypothetical protein [Maridesulfovibrio salexigens]